MIKGVKVKTQEDPQPGIVDYGVGATHLQNLALTMPILSKVNNRMYRKVREEIKKKAKPVAVTQRAGSAERPNYLSSDLNSSRHFCNPILTINKEYNKSFLGHVSIKNADQPVGVSICNKV